MRASRLKGPGLIFAAPASGSGKTTLVAGFLRLLTRRGVPASAAKLGPDYIDPAFHSAALGKACLNIDLWAMRPETVAALLERLSQDGALAVVEGAMGLFDGAADGTASAADFAALTGWPVILVIDARGQAQSAGALLGGFAQHRADIAIAGVIFNRVGGASHQAVLLQAAGPLGIPVLGCVPRAEDLRLPERHLGLVQAMEHGDLESFLERLAARLEPRLDLGKLIDLAGRVRPQPMPSKMEALPSLGQRIAVARDAAYGFVYASQLDAWRQAGSEIAFFSPLADEAPPVACDAVYLPGGYPELHAGRLATGSIFLEGLRRVAARGGVIFGECGGYMTLGTGLVDKDGQRQAMAGLLPLESSFAAPRLHLGYRQASLRDAGPLGLAGAAFRGHEFHYATVIAEGEGEALFDCHDALGRPLGSTGRRRGRIAGSFIHLIDRRV
ncbi:MAG TPA: cobyrinate a,c-diamide synthase [Dongiaceae bacterium]|nr:cobyrinate a,c-diamide synthase [Dongiaceae bacterium]